MRKPTAWLSAGSERLFVICEANRKVPGDVIADKCTHGPAISCVEIKRYTVLVEEDTQTSPQHFKPYFVRVILLDFFVNLCYHSTGSVL